MLDQFYLRVYGHDPPRPLGSSLKYKNTPSASHLSALRWRTRRAKGPKPMLRLAGFATSSETSQE